MHLPNLTDEGLIYRSPELFRAAIEYTLDHWSCVLAYDREECAFLEGASLLAAEVYASGLEWDAISNRYLVAAIEFGLRAEEAVELLELAWKSAPHRPARWIEMTREWVRMRDEGVIVHAASGVAIPEEHISQIFSDIMEDPSCELPEVFLDCLVEVSEISCGPSVLRGFRMTQAGLVLNVP